MSDELQDRVAKEGGRPDVRRQVTTVAAMSLAAAFLLCGYEFIRSVSTSLFIGAYGKERLPAAMALMPVGVLLILYVYGRLLSALGAARALAATSLLSAAVMVGCYAGVRAHWAPAAGILYILREGYIVLILEQYWSLVNSTVTERMGKRLNGPFTGIASLGSIIGDKLLARHAVGIGSEAFILLAAASLVPAALFAGLGYRLAGEPQPAPEEAGGRQGHLGLSLFARTPSLALLALVIASTQVVSGALELRFSGLVADAFPLQDQRTAYLGGFWQWLNIAAAALQFAVAPLLLRVAPLGAVNVAIPVIHCCAGLALAAHPSLRTGAAAYMLFKAIDYSVFRAGKEVLYIPFSYDARYRAKEVIDSFVYRFAKGSFGLAVQGAQSAFGALAGSIYPLAAVGATLVWLPAVVGLLRRHPGDAKRGA